MKRTRLLLLLLFLIFGSCVDNNKTPRYSTETRSVASASIPFKIKRSNRIGDYMSDSLYIHCIANHPDTTPYLCEISFCEDYAIYWFHGQCQYLYFTYKTSDTTIDLLWSYKSDCILNMDFLEKSNGVKSYPRRGDLFATYTLLNDTVISVSYRFPEWIKKVNMMEKDSLFPAFLYLQE
jgi:hypothetical protein